MLIFNPKKKKKKKFFLAVQTAVGSELNSKCSFEGRRFSPSLFVPSPLSNELLFIYFISPRLDTCSLHPRGTNWILRTPWTRRLCAGGCGNSSAFILLLELKSALRVASKASSLVDIHGNYICRGGRAEWTHHFGADVAAFPGAGGFDFYCAGFSPGAPQIRAGFGAALPPIVAPFTGIGLKVFLLYPSGCSSEETFLLPKYTHRLGLKGLKPTTKFLPPSHHH